MVVGGGTRRCGVPPSAAKTIDVQPMPQHGAAVQPMPDGGVAAGAWPVPGVASVSFAITEAAEEHPLRKDETALFGTRPEYVSGDYNVCEREENGSECLS